MMMKKVAIVVLMSSIFGGMVCGAVKRMQVSSNAREQAQDLIVRYQGATGRERKRYERELRELRAGLIHQSEVYGGAMEDEAMSGDIEASIVNEQEQVELRAALDMVNAELAKIDGGSATKKAVKSKKGSRFNQ